MNLFGRLSQTFSAIIERMGHPRAGLPIGPSGDTNTANETVTEETALAISAYWAGIRLLSESIAMLPLCLYRKRPEGGKEKIEDDPRARLFNNRPNEFHTTYQVIEVMTKHMVATGNAYAKITRSTDKWTIEPRLPTKVQVNADENGVFYVVPELEEIIDFEDMLHPIGPSNDGIIGLNLIQVAQQSLGTAMATDKYAGSFFGNGARPSGILSTEQRIDPKNREALRREWEKRHAGGKNAGASAILGAGLSWQPLSMTNDEAQFLESRRFTINEIARWLRVPPHMLGDLERATFSNIEEEGLNFVKYSLVPWLRRWETELERKLLAEDETDLFFQFDVDSVLRADTKTRFETWSIAKQQGIMTTNEIRDKENMDPIEGGDEIRERMDTQPAGDDQQDSQDDDEGDEDSQNPFQQSAESSDYLSMLQSDAARESAVELLVARSRRIEQQCAIRAAERYVYRGENFIKWVDEGYHAIDDLRALEGFDIQSHEDWGRERLLEAAEVPADELIERVSRCLIVS